jgi:hypothetical protein
MIEFLSKNLPYLIEQGTISIQVDVKHIGKQTSGDYEVSALGTLLVFYDSLNNKRKTYLISYEPIKDKTDQACASDVLECLEEYKILKYQRQIGAICDAGQRGVAEYITLLAAICGAHTIQCGIEGMITMAEKHMNLDDELFADIDSFVSFCRHGLTLKEKKKLKLKASDHHSISDYFAREQMTDQDRERIFKITKDTNGLNEYEIRDRAKKLKGFPLLRGDNGIRWNKMDENLGCLVAWSPKLKDLAEDDHQYSYLIPSRIAFPDLDFCAALKIISSNLLKYTRLLEDSSSKVFDKNKQQSQAIF